LLRQFVSIDAELVSDLIVTVGRIEKGEAGCQRAIEQKRFGKAELILRLPSSTLKRDGQRFTKPEKIIGFIAQAEESAADTAHTAIETDRIPALFFDFQIDVDLRLSRARFDLGVLSLDFLEVAQLIQPLQAHIPRRRIENLAFRNHDFPADDLVLSGCIVGKRDMVYVK